MATPKQELIESRYDGDLAADIAAWSATGTTWRDMAQTVSERTGRTVSHESLRNWYGATLATAP